MIASLFKISFEGFSDMLGWAAIFLLQIISAVTYLAGTILNYVIKFTIVDMKANVDLMGIADAWGVIRDVANMGFIFVLLYAAIMTIIGQGQDNKKLIVNVVIAAILINFSLFITQLIIDAANVLALFFYGTMVPASALVKGSAIFDNLGLANAIMDPLKLASIWEAKGELAGTQLLTIGIMGSTVALVAAFVFLAIAILFVIRFVVLLFVMILSPIAFVAGVLPGINNQAKQWWGALTGQAFFAPIYFLLTWIVIKISQNLPSSTSSLSEAFIGTFEKSTGADGAASVVANHGSIAVVFNFIIIIALLIVSLVTAKEWANKAGPGVTKLTKWATGQAGNATFGLAGRVGRGTVGVYGSRLADSEELKEMAENKDGKYNRRQQMRARLNLMAGQKLQKQSFDARGTGLGGTLDAGKAQGKGGFAQKLKDDTKAKKEFADSLKPSAIVIDEAEREVKRHAEGTEERKKAQDRLDALKGVNKEEMEKREKDALKNDPVVKTKKEIEEENEKLKTQEKEIEREVKEKEEEIAKTIVPQMVKQREEELKLFKEQKANELRIAKEEFDRMRDASEARTKKIKSTYRKGGDSDGEFQTIDSAEQRRKNVESDYQRDSRIFGKGKTEKEGWNKILYIPKANKQAAAEIKKTKKSAKELVDEALKATGETTEEKKEDKKEDDKDETSKESTKE